MNTTAEPIDYVLARLAASIASATILVPALDKPHGAWPIPSDEVPAWAVVEAIVTAQARLPADERMALLEAWGWGPGDAITFAPGTEVTICALCRRIIVRESGAAAWWHLVDLATGAQTLACPDARSDDPQVRVAHPV